MESWELNVFKLIDFSSDVKLNKRNLKIRTKTTIDIYIKNKNSDNNLILKPKSKYNLFMYIINYIFLVYYIIFYIFYVTFHNNYNIKYIILITEIFGQIIFIIDFVFNIIKFNISKKPIFSKSLKKYYYYKKLHIFIDLLNLVPFLLFFYIIKIEYFFFNIFVYLRYLKLYFFFNEEKVKIIKKTLFKKYFKDPMIEKIYYLLIIIWVYIFIFINWRIFTFKSRDNYDLKIDKENLNIWDLLIISGYWVFQTMFTVGYGDIKYLGYGDIKYLTKSEIIVSVLCMVLGVYVYSLLISRILSILDRNKGKKKLEYLRNLHSINKRYKINKFLQNEIKFFINKKE